MLRRFSFLLGCCMLLALPMNCLAQSNQPKPKPAGVPNFDLYGGYSYVFNSFYAVNSGGMSGWDAAVKVPLWRSFFGIKGDVSGYNKTGALDISTKNMFYLVGPQVGMHLSTSTIFLHGLVGGAHLSNEVQSSSAHNSIALALGAGLDAGMSRRLAWRVTGDFYNTHFHNSSDNIAEVKNSTGRFSTGPVFRF